MDRFEAGRALGLADADIVGVEETEDGTAVATRDGGDRLITADGVFALSDHPATKQLRRWKAEEQGEQLEAEPDEEDAAAASASAGGEVPDGSADDVLTWVGEDLERAAEALAVEENREHPRSTLIAKLRKLRP